jgi:DNA-directed RNA polymerase subunit L
MAAFEVISTKAKVSLKSEFRNFPITFVNGLRRVALSDLPIVVIRDIQILDNTTQMPHEMLKHRMEMLPVNVYHTDTNIIRDAIVELRVFPQEQDMMATTDNFTVESGRENLIMRDRELGTPLLFLRIRKGESVHIKGKLAVEKGSQVSNVSYAFHIDPERADDDRKKFVESGKDVREFNNFYIQKSYSIDKIGRPNWIDLGIESVGVMSAKDIMRLAVAELKRQIDSWMENALENITREAENNVYHVKLDQGGNTVGYLVQEVMYNSGNVSFASYDPVHPLRPTTVVRFVTQEKPELLLKETQKTIHEYCDIVEKGL